MGRQHVHMADRMPEDPCGCISGMRKSCDLVITVNVTAATLQGGLAFFRSANGVILTPGLGKQGLLPLAFFARVIDRKTGAEYPIPKAK